MVFVTVEAFILHLLPYKFFRNAESGLLSNQCTNRDIYRVTIHPSYVD